MTPTALALVSLLAISAASSAEGEELAPPAPPTQAGQEPREPEPETTASARPWEDRIVWEQSAGAECLPCSSEDIAPRRKAFFVPQAVLQQIPLDALPIGCEGRSDLRWRLGLEEGTTPLRRYYTPERWRAEQRAKQTEPIRDCQVLQGGFREVLPTPVGPPVPMASLVATREVVVIAEVTAAVSGLLVAGARPAEMVYLRIDEVLRDRAGRLVQGAEIFTPRAGATIRVNGQELCAEAYPGTLTAGVGDEILVAGTLAPSPQGVLYSATGFLIYRGLIQPSATAVVLDEMPMPVRLLRTQLLDVEATE